MSQQHDVLATLQKLPPLCYIEGKRLGIDCTVIAVRRGVVGYFPVPEYIGRRMSADELNAGERVTVAQREAMLNGSMFGWEIPLADPDNWNEDGTYRHGTYRPASKNSTTMPLDTRLVGAIFGSVADRWAASPDPLDPDNFWIDDATHERVDAASGERTPMPHFMVDRRNALASPVGSAVEVPPETMQLVGGAVERRYVKIRAVSTLDAIARAAHACGWRIPPKVS